LSTDGAALFYWEGSTYYESAPDEMALLRLGKLALEVFSVALPEYSVVLTYYLIAHQGSASTLTLRMAPTCWI
jgi:hypothetical protein